MKNFAKNSSIILIGIGSLILPILDRSFFSVVSEHSYLYTILAGIIFVISPFIAIIPPTLIINPKVFKKSYLKFVVLTPLVFFILILIIQPEWANALNTIFDIVFFPIELILFNGSLNFLAPLFFLILLFLAPYLLSKYVQKSKNKFIDVIYLILYTYTNLVITISIWTIIYFE